MFSCRMTIEDKARLDMFLELATLDGAERQNRFRYLLRELQGRLYRNTFGELKLRPLPSEVDQEEFFAVLNQIRRENPIPYDFGDSR